MLKHELDIISSAMNSSIFAIYRLSRGQGARLSPIRSSPFLSIFTFFCWLCFLTATVITYIQSTGPFFFFCGSQQCCLTMHYPGFECRHRITLQSEANSNTLIVESVNEDAFRNASHTMGNVNISDVTQ